MQFAVTAAELLSAATQCTNTNSLIQGQIRQMQNLLIPGYQGPTANQYMALNAEWESAATRLNAVLTDIANGLTANANTYTTSEGANTSNYTRILGALPPARF